MSLTSLLRGKSAEALAASYLRKQGLKILAQNKKYKCGEIDIVATDKEDNIFVEVKYRSDSSHGSSAEMVSQSKQAKLAKSAKLWLQENDPQFAKGCRFDVIAINKDTAAKNQDNIEWLKNAFTPELW